MAQFYKELKDLRVSKDISLEELETRTKINMQKYPLWYKAQAIMKLLQGFGRSIRDYGDWADTYVLDSAAHELLLMNRKMVPHAYHDIIFPSSFKEFLG